MGLDMYLVDATGNELGYWRKANAIHGWFVRELAGGVDECQNIPVTRIDLERLQDACAAVLNDISKAEELLPPTEGFFFGSYDIDNYYQEDLRDTLKIIDNILANTKKRKFVYRASW